MSDGFDILLCEESRDKTLFFSLFIGDDLRPTLQWVYNKGVSIRRNWHESESILL